MKKITAITMILAMLLSIMTFTVSAANAEGEDPSPANVGVLTTNNGIDISYVRQFIDGEGTPFLAGGGVGAHGGHETRIVRTPNGTYATYITNATGAPDAEHPNWYNGVVTFDVIKITASGFESIYQAIYPQAAGSCTPNVLFDGDHTVYVTIIADDKDRYAETRGDTSQPAPDNFTNGIWLEVIEIDTDTDTVSHHAGPAFYDHTTTPFEDHGYGYSQPCLDVAHGKLYMITNGGEAEDPDYTGYGNQAGYMAWWVYDLNTHTWDPACRTIKFFSRRCYMNVYPDGNGGFTMVTERCAPTRELGKAIGCTFRTNGYIWDALYVMHIANPLDNCYVGQKPASVIGNSSIYEWGPERDTVVWEPSYTVGGNNFDCSASHYGTGGCTYLDDQNRIHVIYTITYYTTPTVKSTKMIGVYHAMYTLEGEELYNELIPSTLLSGNPSKSFKGPNGYAMTQGPDGTYYVFIIKKGTGSSATLLLEIWAGTDGVNFTKTATNVSLKFPDGSAVADGTKPIIGNTRNGSVLDGVIPIMFHTGGSSGDPYYYFSVKVPGEVHTHSYTAVVTPPTVTAGGYTTYTCSCGDSYVSDYTDPLMQLSASLCLKDSTDLNVYVSNVPAEAVSDGYYIMYGTDPAEMTQAAFSEATEVSEGKYKFSVASFNANQLADYAHFVVYDGTGAELKYLQYSVKDYCDSVIADPEQPEGLKNVCGALMAYGYFAQERFFEGSGVALDPYPYSDAIEAVNALDVNEMDEYESHAEYVEPYTGVGASLALKSKTELSFFIKGVSDVGDFSLTVGGQDWDDFEVVTSATKCRVIVKGLRPVDLASTVEFQDNNAFITIDYSPMAYARYVAASNADPRDVNLCKALYLYAMAAIGYFPAD